MGEIFTLQRAAFVDEARLYKTPFVPALDDTFEDLVSRLEDSISWVATRGERIVGAISLRTYRTNTVEPDCPNVERLMVAPDCQGQGISSALLQVAEVHARDQGHQWLQLVVGELAVDNRAIYTHLGWVEHSTARLNGFEHVVLKTMTKRL